VIVKLECVDEIQRVAITGGNVRTTGYQPEIGSPCRQVDTGERVLNGDEACVVTLNAGLSSDDDSMFCHPDMNICVKPCQSATDCPAAWQCDTRDETIQVTAGRPYCVNPTCNRE
jgi:hypothetical protein